MERDGLADLGRAKVVLRREARHAAKLLVELEVLVKHLRVHGGRHDVNVADDRVFKALLELGAQLVKVERRHRLAGAAGDGRLALEHARAQRLGEALRRLAELALEVLDDGAREGKLLGAVDDGALVEAVLDHELGKVADSLGARRHLGRVVEKAARDLVALLDLGPLVRQAERERLEVQVGVLKKAVCEPQIILKSCVSAHLATGNGVEVDVGGAALHRDGALKRSVEAARLLPVVAHL